MDCGQACPGPRSGAAMTTEERKPDQLTANFIMQIKPVKIVTDDAVYFPASLPVFHLFFTRYGGFHGLMLLKINQRFDAVFFGKAFGHANI